jgi:MFS superfamily sulfate permease-like transporter
VQARIIQSGVAHLAARGFSLDRIFPLLGIIRDQDRTTVRRDLVAGLTVALFTIPQAMAYALVAGFPPSTGIMTAVVASILGAAFGSSEVLVNGPTNAIAVMLTAHIALSAADLGDPVSEIIALTLLIGILQLLAGTLRLGSSWLLAPAADYIPIAVLAGTLIHIGLKLVNLGRMRWLIQTTAADRTALLVTFFAVLGATHLEYALLLGVVVSIFQALRRAEGFNLELLAEGPGGHLIELPLKAPPGGRVVAIDLQGELFFAGAEELEQRLKEIYDSGTRALVLRLAHAYNLDAICAEAIAQVARYARSRRGHLILAGVKPGMYGTLERAGLVRDMGAEAIFRHEPLLLSATTKALAYAHALVGEDEAPGRAADPTH